MSESTVRVPIDSSSSSGEESKRPKNKGESGILKIPPKSVVPSGPASSAPPKASGATTDQTPHSPRDIPKTSIKAKPKVPHRKNKNTLNVRPSSARDRERDRERDRDSRRGRDSYRGRDASSHRARDREGRRRSKSRSRRRFDQRIGPSNPTTPRHLTRNMLYSGFCFDLCFGEALV